LAIQIRRLTWGDIEAIARLHRASEPVDHAGRARDAVAVLRRWRRPEGRMDEDCLVAEAQGTLVGYAMRSMITGTDQCVVHGVVHPGWRRRGVGRQLLDRTAEDARLAGARTLDVRARDDEASVVAFCEAVGLRLVRRWLRMWIEPLRPPSFPFPAGYGWRHFRPRHDEPAYSQLVTETFGDHWGIGPTTIESVSRMVGQPGFEPTNILFALWGREIVGVCTIRLVERTMGRREYATAHIGPLGVRALHRSRGLAHGMLSLSLRRCQRRHIDAAELDVDETNAPAIHVYENCGFRILFGTLWYRRELG
jgi:mycothiol synthase